MVRPGALPQPARVQLRVPEGGALRDRVLLPGRLPPGKAGVPAAPARAGAVLEVAALRAPGAAAARTRPLPAPRS